MSDRLRPRELLWLAGRGGPGDRTRIVLTAVGGALATVALLAAATVVSIGPQDGPYGPEVLAQPGLRPGVVTALVLLCVPVLGFAGQCSRIAAPARERRLAAVRMAGATPGDVRRVVQVETGLAALLGAVLGLAAYVVARPLLAVSHPGFATREVRRADGGVTFIQEPTTVLQLPTDVLPPWWALALVVLGPPVLAALASAAALRRVSVGPLGVLRHRDRRPARALPALLFLGGLLAAGAVSAVLEALSVDTAGVAVGIFLLILLVVITGLILGSAALSAMAGRFVADRTSRPALLIAGRRLTDDPHAAGRAFGVVAIAVLFGGGALAYRSFLVAVTDPEEDFYLRTMDLVLLVVGVAVVLASLGLLVAASEGVLARRRTLAALGAAGTPASTLRWAVMAESAIPLLFVVPLAGLAGLLCVRGAVFPEAGGYGPSTDPALPWLLAAGWVAAVIVVALTVTSVSLVFLRVGTDVSELRAS